MTRFIKEGFILDNNKDKYLMIIYAYEEFAAEVERAMGKVGWNNSRIETAYDLLQEKIGSINVDKK